MNLPRCHICDQIFEEDEGFYCNDCGEPTCNGCGDGDLCNLCIGDEIFFFGALDG